MTRSLRRSTTETFRDTKFVTYARVPARLVTMPCGFLPAFCAARGRVGGVVEVDVARRVLVAGEADAPVGRDVELHEQVAVGRHDVGVAAAALVREGHRPGAGEEQLLLARLGLLGAAVEVQEAARAGVALASRADAGDDVDEGLRVDVEAQRAVGRGGDVRQEGVPAADDDALQLVGERARGVGLAVARRVDGEAGDLGAERDRAGAAGSRRCRATRCRCSAGRPTPSLPSSAACRPPGRVKARKPGDVQAVAVAVDGQAARLEVAVACRAGCSGCRRRSTWPMTLRGERASMTLIVSWPLLATKIAPAVGRGDDVPGLRAGAQRPRDASRGSGRDPGW